MKLDLNKVKWNHYVNYAVVGAFVIVFAILSLTGNTKSSTEFLLEKLAIAITLAVSLSIVIVSLKAQSGQADHKAAYRRNRTADKEGKNKHGYAVCPLIKHGSNLTAHICANAHKARVTERKLAKEAYNDGK